MNINEREREREREYALTHLDVVAANLGLFQTRVASAR